jgi:predicted transposase/invertase (TIGR01784 family)
MVTYEKSVTDYHDVQLAMKCSHYEGFRDGEEKGIKKGFRDGKERGREQGIKAGISQIAMEMKKTGMSIDLITQLTKLTPEQIRKIKEQ